MKKIKWYIIKDDINRVIAHTLNFFHVRPGYSCSIADFLTCGYGRLDSYGEFQFALNPDEVKAKEKVS